MAINAQFSDVIHSLRPTCMCFPFEGLYLGIQLLRMCNAHAEVHTTLCSFYQRACSDHTLLHEALQLLSTNNDCVKRYTSLWFSAKGIEDYPILCINLDHQTCEVKRFQDVNATERIQDIIEDQFETTFENTRNYRQKIRALDPNYFHEVPLLLDLEREGMRAPFFVGSAQFDRYTTEILTHTVFESIVPE